MSVTASLGKLKNAAKDLHLQWSEVQAFWYDENARHLQTNYLEPLLARVRMVELAMGQIAAVLQKARHDCE